MYLLVDRQRLRIATWHGALLRLFLVLICLIFSAPLGNAEQPQDEPELARSIASVVSAPTLDHIIRVVVDNRGFEHVSSKVYIQWLVPDESAKSGLRLEGSTVVKEVSGGMWSIGQPRIDKSGSEVRIALEGTQIHRLEPKRFLVVPTSLGEYRIQEEEINGESGR